MIFLFSSLAFQENEEEDEELRDYISKTQLRERQFLLTLKHKNIINMIEDFEMKEDASLHLVFEILPENCLDVLNRHPKGLRLSAVKIITKQLFEALEFCHRNHVVSIKIIPERMVLKIVLERPFGQLPWFLLVVASSVESAADTNYFYHRGVCVGSQGC